MTMNTVGKLYGTGVGPGDPELLTLKAVRVINEADVIFTAASSKNSYSLAVEIARPHIRSGAEIISLPFPMTREKEVTESAWLSNASTIADVLRSGRTAVFLTLGDPNTYSTFGYIMKSMKVIMPEAVIEIVPGITSFHAAAARLNRTLVEADQSLLITSGAFGGQHLKTCMDSIENLVMMKTYKNTRLNNQVLKDTGFFENSVAISKCGREGEEVIDNIAELENRKPDYWTLILAGK